MSVSPSPQPASPSQVPAAHLNACTIVSKNYIPYARVLARSFLEAQPEGRFFVLLVDRNDGHIDAEEECFTLLEAEDLDNVPHLSAFLFKYTLLEANTAIKPFFLEYLFRRFELPNLVYFDPDILIVGRLDALAALVRQYSVVLTPHLTSPIEDDAHPDELAILQAGSYNLGFVALRWTEVSERLLSWWQQRLYDQCVVRIDRGLFVDQKWMDLVPGIFGDVHVLIDPGYNVAYWNLHGRRVTCDDGTYRSNGEPLVFFHFSGIQPESLEHVSKHQDRFVLSDLGAAAELYRHYSSRVIDAGYFTCKPWPYAFARFDNGVKIPDAARALFLDFGADGPRRFGDPFAADGDDSDYAWLNRPADGAPRRPPHLTRLLAHIHGGRPDLVATYPRPQGKDFAAFCAWLSDYGRHELKLDDAFLATAHRESRATLLTVDGLKRRLRNRLKRLYNSSLGQRGKAIAKGLLGRQRSRALKARLRPTPVTVSAAQGQPVSPVLALPPSMERPGVNLVGYLQAETGMGEAARSLARAFTAAGIPLSLHSLELNVLARRQDATFAAQQSEFPYDINLFVVNADQVQAVREHLGDAIFGGRYNVGLWLWELERFPAAFRHAFDPLHEIWTPSSFCVDAISSASPRPVRRVPLPVEPISEVSHRRGHFDLADDDFLFLYMFNYLSYFERKNPLAAVAAFRQAFRPEEPVRLLLKTSQSDFAPDARDRLQEAIGDANIQLLDGYLSRDEISSLTANADAYLSLHRSEGFGLTLAESMYYGKPVIAAPYSGNRDFFNLNNGLPVRYDLVELGEHAGPYPAGSRWAEPDIDHAAEQMRRLMDDADLRQRLSERARRDIRQQLSVEAVAQILRQRFDDIVGRVGRSGARVPGLE